ncbi:MAG: CapA family protein [Caulobacteraceae bacterium]
MVGECHKEKVHCRYGCSLCGCGGCIYNNYIRAVHVKAVGDILLDRGVKKYLEKYGYDYPYSWIQEEIKASDIAVANLECPITDSRQAVLKYSHLIFKGNEANAGALKTAGFDVLNLANNHTMDYEREGLLDTIKILNDLEVLPVGAGAARSKARKPVYVRTMGKTIGFLSYSIFPTEGFIYDENKADVARVDTESLSAEVEAAKSRCDFLVVQFHWGIKFDNYPTADQKQLAHTAIENGADMVLGHHPHVLQGVEIYEDKPVFYSLGNFVFDKQIPPGTDETLLVDVSIKGRDWTEVRLIPVMIKECRPELAKGKDAERILEKLRVYSKDYGTDIQIADGTGYIFR